MRSERAGGGLRWGAAAGDLRLGIAVEGATARLGLENVGAAAFDVMSHVAAVGEKHFDWYTVVLDGPGGQRELSFVDDRNRSAPIRVTLAPGEALEQAIDLAAWAARAVNGTAPLAAGRHEARARYEVGAQEGAWHGRLEAGPVELWVGAGDAGVR